MKKLTIEIDELAPGPNGKNGLRRMHWAAYRKLRDRWTWKVREQTSPTKTLEKAHVSITRHHTGRGIRDYDNLYASAKLVLDALVAAGVVADDSMEHILDLKMDQERVPKRDQVKTVIEVCPAN